MDLDLGSGVPMMHNELRDTDRVLRAMLISWFLAMHWYLKWKLRFGFELLSHEMTSRLIFSYFLGIVIYETEFCSWYLFSICIWMFMKLKVHARLLLMCLNVWWNLLFIIIGTHNGHLSICEFSYLLDFSAVFSYAVCKILGSKNYFSASCNKMLAYLIILVGNCYWLVLKSLIS